MNLSKSTKKLLLITLSVIAIHSLFPPRIYVKDSTSAGRSFILWSYFQKADYDSIDFDTQYGSITYAQVTKNSGNEITTWNPAVLDLGVYLAEAVLIFSLAMILLLRRDGKQPVT